MPTMRCVAVCMCACVSGVWNRKCLCSALVLFFVSLPSPLNAFLPPLHGARQKTLGRMGGTGVMDDVCFLYICVIENRRTPTQIHNLSLSLLQVKRTRHRQGIRTDTKKNPVKVNKDMVQGERAEHGVKDEGEEEREYNYECVVGGYVDRPLGVG